MIVIVRVIIILMFCPYFPLLSRGSNLWWSSLLLQSTAVFSSTHIVSKPILTDTVSLQVFFGPPAFLFLCFSISSTNPTTTPLAHFLTGPNYGDLSLTFLCNCCNPHLLATSSSKPFPSIPLPFISLEPCILQSLLSKWPLFTSHCPCFNSVQHTAL